MAKRIATFIIALGGFLAIPIALYAIGPSAHVVAIAVACGEVVLVTVVYFFDTVLDKPVLSRIYGLSAPRDSILLSGQQHFVINDEFALAEGEVTKRIVFLKAADPEEMYDTFESSGEEIADGHWTSDDSTFVGEISRGRNHRKALKWRPNRAVDSWSEYTHSIKKTAPGRPYSWGPDGFYWLVDFDRPTGRFEVTIDCPVAIESAVWCTLSRRHRRQVPQRQRYLWRIYTGRRKNRATVSDDGKSMRWEISNPAYPQSYLILCVFTGQRETFKSLRDREPPRLLSRTPWLWTMWHRDGRAAESALPVLPQAPSPSTHSNPPAR